MEIKKQACLGESDIIKASEIGQYHYCSISWYLQKCGYKPKSLMLDIGIKRHMELGKTIDNTQLKIKKYKLLAITGYILLIFGFLIFLFEVIL